MTTIQDRLREDVFYGEERMHKLSKHNPLHMEAADRIDALERENARLCRLIGRYASAIGKVEGVTFAGELVSEDAAEIEQYAARTALSGEGG